MLISRGSLSTFFNCSLFSVSILHIALILSATTARAEATTSSATLLKPSASISKLSASVTNTGSEKSAAQTQTTDPVESVKTIVELVTFDNLYKAKLYGFTITVNNRLSKITDNRYDLLFKADSMLGSITEKSNLEWNAKTQTVIPLKYSYKRKSIGKNKIAELLFDWQTKMVTNNVDKTLWKMDIESNVQDKISYQVQLQQDLINGKKNFIYQIADGGYLKEYKFITEGEEILDTPLGKVTAIKVKRSRDNDERVTYAWLAKDWHYLLVQLQQEEKGTAYTITIQQASINGQSIDHF